jgi:hypothetical protein
MAGGRRPLGALCEVRAHIAPSKFGVAAPTAFHPRPSWAPDEIECRVLLNLPHTNSTPTPVTALRYTITAERQNLAVVLLKVNVLAAAQTDRHVSSANRIVSVIEQSVLGRGILQLFHFTAGLERTPQLPRAGVPQDQSAAIRVHYSCLVIVTVCIAPWKIRDRKPESFKRERLNRNPPTHLSLDVHDGEGGVSELAISITAFHLPSGCFR